MTIKETEIGGAIIAWLEEQHWDCYSEVQVYSLGHVADIVAVRGPLIYVIECKATLSLKVLEQASGWRCHLRSIAVPKQKYSRYRSGGRSGAYQIAKRCLEVGVLEVNKRRFVDGSDVWDVEEVVRPKLKRDFHEMAQRIRLALTPEHKTYMPAGSAGGSHWTPYKSTMRDVQRFISNNPGCTFKEIGDDLGRMHYSNIASAIGNLRKALFIWEKDWCFVDKDCHPHRCYIRQEQAALERKALSIKPDSVT